MLRVQVEMERDLAVFHRLVNCGRTVYRWVYSEDGELLETDCQTMLPHLLFQHSGCLEYAVSNIRECQAPMFLNSQLGLMWAAVLEDRGENGIIHVIGPCLSRNISLNVADSVLRAKIQNFGELESVETFLRNLSVVPPIVFQEYALMLHYCIYEKKLTPSDIYIQSEAEVPEGQRETEGDSYQTYLAEKALLRCVREGDLNYKEAMTRSHATTGGIQVSEKKSVAQAIISVSSFIALCERAAIEGGLSPNTAFNVGERYVQSLAGCRSITEAGAISRMMFEDFVHRVRRSRENSNYSRVVRDCVEYIELYPEGKLSIQSIAKQFGYSDYYLSRIFKKEVGESINNYIKYVRIERAKLLLETTDRSVSNIASVLHFCSSTYFSDSFREVVGCSPSHYREKSRSS